MTDIHFVVVQLQAQWSWNKYHQCEEMVFI